MQTVTIDHTSLLIGDRIAGEVLRYAAHLDATRSVDDVTIRAIDPDGREVSFLLPLGGWVPLVAEHSDSTLPEPLNEDALEYIEDRMADFAQYAEVRPAEPQPAE
ncbi:hypothetical protein GCM10025783_02770 [Amnibacterium soli]|uniref:Uncharacterized protein n=1 Tax=Amnibacterium soli TaxID=1282736 RepID=A0ABP8YRE9_9MICO